MHKVNIFRLTITGLMLASLSLIIKPVIAHGDDVRDGLLKTALETESELCVDGPAQDRMSVFAQGTSGIVVDHNSLSLFEDIPEEYIQAAEDLNMFFIDRSVGGNINEGLDCLNYPSDEVSPIGCRRIEHVDPTFNVDPSELNWSRTGGYNRGNWVYEYWPIPGCDGWSGKVDCFLNRMDSDINQYDVVSFQFSYLAVDEGSTIEDQPGGFFWDNSTMSDVFDQEAFEALHPDKHFIYWTTSLARSIGTEESEVFNQQMRDYAVMNGKALFDVADILSHDPAGNPCFDNRDGIPYDNGVKFEDYPDDGVDRPAICQHYTTEVDGGHLGSVSVGKIRVAKAFWILMAQIAGWNPDGSNDDPKIYLPIIAK